MLTSRKHQLNQSDLRISVITTYLLQARIHTRRGSQFFYQDIWIKNACDFFIDVSKKSDLEIAKLIESLSINILIDINGHTKGSRLEIFSYLKNIPKVGFLGYPGTVGGDINQYIVADSIVIPPKEKVFFSEKVIYMPNTYQCTDRNTEISKEVITRSDCKLPKNGFRGYSST